VLRYFGEGECSGDGVEERLTWTRFLAQRRLEKRYEQAQQKAYDAGMQLGYHHGIHSARPAANDAEYDRAVNGLDEETFRAGYSDGLIAAIDITGDLVDLPAIVTRDGAVHRIALTDLPAITETFSLLDELTVDVEHTGYPIGHADYKLRTIQVGNDAVAVVFDADATDQVAAAADLLRDARILHAHSATADLVPLAVAGAIDLEPAWDRMHDTVIPAKLADPTSTGSDPGLKELAAAILGAQATSPSADAARATLFKAGRWLTNIKPLTLPVKSGWAQSDKRAETMVRYAASDVLDAAALAKQLPPVTPAVLERERTAQRMTARVAFHGVRLDGEHVSAKLVEHRTALGEAATLLQTFGIDNPGSDQQIAAKLVELGAPLPRTKTGRPSVAKGAIEPFAKADGTVGDLVRARLDYQHHETVIGLFLEPYTQLVTSGDGRARPTVYTLGADTGRMSCVRPNLQQVPRQGGIRSCITADPGEVVISADFASVEVRVAAALTGDTNLQAMLAAGVDLHMQTARQAYGPDATKEDRYNTKRAVFGRLYGSGIPGIARTLGITEAEAAAIVASLDAMTPGMTRWIEGLKHAVQGGMKTFETYSGRVIHLDPRLPHKAFNYCVQGTARELLVDALMRWQQTNWGNARLIPVHDEVLVFVPEDDADEATAALTAAMQSELYGVAIKAEASEPSFSWKDAS
jgi:DNA polymerase I-like protein with 3'-5' exonuclease and polymerase domains